MRSGQQPSNLLHNWAGACEMNSSGLSMIHSIRGKRSCKLQLTSHTSMHIGQRWQHQALQLIYIMHCHIVCSLMVLMQVAAQIGWMQMNTALQACGPKGLQTLIILVQVCERTSTQNVNKSILPKTGWEV